MSEIDCHNRQTLNDIYRRMAPAVMHKCMRIVKDQAIAEEIMQQTFLKLWQDKMRFPDEKVCFRWLYQTSHNAAIDHLRSAYNRTKSDTPTVPIEDFPDLFTPCNREQNRELLTMLLAGLSEDEGQLLFYTSFEGLSQKEIGELLGVSEKTVYREIVKLKTKLLRLKERIGA